MLRTTGHDLKEGQPKQSGHLSIAIDQIQALQELHIGPRATEYPAQSGAAGSASATPVAVQGLGTYGWHAAVQHFRDDVLLGVGRQLEL